MLDRVETLSVEEVERARKARLEAQHLQFVEGNPLTGEEVAMFEMFERERWSHERRRAFIMERLQRDFATRR